MSKPHVVVLGNEKGGSGKSTTAMHVLVGLLHMGFRAGSIDLDARQGTLSRYLQNRADFAAANGLRLPVPEHRAVHRSVLPDQEAAQAEETERFQSALAELAEMDFVVIDSPGSDTFLSRLGHVEADTLITPLNDSFVDLDMLAKVDPAGHRILRPSLYAEMVWEQRKQRALKGGRPIDWIVMRNRLGHLDARSKRQMGALLEQLAKRIGFRVAPGFGERVIYRELFPKGLTLLDLREPGTGVEMSLSHVAARQEVRHLLVAMGLERVEECQALI